MKSQLSRIFFVTIFLSLPLFAAMDRRMNSEEVRTYIVQCPNIEEIKAAEIDIRDMIQIREPRQRTDINGFPYTEPGEYQTRDYVGNFGTNNEWTWAMYSIQAFSVDEAWQIAHQKLSSLSVMRGPFSGQLFYSYCSYEDPVLFDSVVAFTKK